MKIQVYAALKEYYDKEFELDGDIRDVAALKEQLRKLNGAADGVLRSCRFAVDDTFVGADYQLKEDDVVSVIPPSSGG
ncbi:MoaD/ThiS family protein [Pontibacter sp. SGAir0037]|uniref:MoaD/ThiS family protein n=1 Tax=Pontibacter sp. SGAir0037 TaxID=2571030 RepID=UPI00143D7CB6|nr:MoaD/ThiS family protein [Pontibacter sp. SGAir0037]